MRDETTVAINLRERVMQCAFKIITTHHNIHANANLLPKLCLTS